MSEFFAMGGYASYVWPAYAVFFLVLAWDWIAPLVQRQRVLRDIRARLQRRAARGGAAR
ncbi:MAG: heme exporter protein CcmD [Lysobacterales bacterium]